MQDKPDPDPTRLEDAGELARRFEQLWRAGDRPRIEDFLQRATPADAASPGAPVAVDGKMVDRPVLLKAQSILVEAELLVPL